MKQVIFFFFLMSWGNFSCTQERIVPTEERVSIIYMREEEKLARDVYEAMFARWNSNPFGNIRFSEQTHMDRMEALIREYSLTDPVKTTNDQPGKFVNPELQVLYNALILEGNKSFIDALTAGAKIEEIDIADLNKGMSKTQNQNMINVYSALKRASENHLNAFTGMLSRQGIDYKPTVLTQREFDQIRANDHRGMKW